MLNITIIHCTAEQYRKQISQLWDECLPGTPPERFNWLAHGNPAGPTEWFLAITDQSELVGTSSVMPKELFFNGRQIRGGIVGDIMTASVAQHKGVARQIQKRITGSLAELEMEFLCVVPNQKSKSLFLATGAWQQYRLRNYLLPVDVGYYMKKIGGAYLQRSWHFLGFFFTGNVHYRGKDNFSVGNIQDILDWKIDDLWQKVRAEQGVLVGTKDISYLRWKYCTWKHADFSLLKYREDSGKLGGFCIFTVEQGKIYIYEMLCSRLRNYQCLLSALTTWARKEQCKGIYLYTVKQNPMLRKSKKIKLFRIGGDMDLFCYGNIFKQFPPWLYFAGDRNL